ncbi:hypothetical protein N7517_005800 [Penicillium concentricum]|uniref:Uncharacterized protein n=1 Tax=Penicillium concentricum TaxID=293559 RepID=A0A9W9VAP9_9EURO|nr:uncharacterized protein N7517_005800 [Penicillium concentricum]KAJ5373794.1 hypothetical protein N7517_005800 [Penicillium concentricum]
MTDCHRATSLRSSAKGPTIAAPLYTEATRNELLTKANCSSAPKFIASQSEKQGETDWVPGGHMDLILTERVPGSDLSHRWVSLYSVVPRNEPDEIRAAFKNAWL